MPQKMNLHDRLVAKGWRKDRKRRWGISDGPKEYTFREACLRAGLVTTPAVQRKPGCTPDLEKRNKKGELCSKGCVPPPTDIPRTLEEDQWHQRGGSNRDKIRLRRRRMKVKVVKRLPYGEL